MSGHDQALSTAGSLVVGLSQEHSQCRGSADGELGVPRSKPFRARGLAVPCAVLVSKFGDALRDRCQVA
jgi:hypothetical protein